MKVLELCLSKSMGGLELYFHKTSKKLADHHTVLSCVKSGTRLQMLAHKEAQKPFLLKSDNLLFQSLFLLKLIQRQEIDIVHVHHKDDLPLCTLVKFFSKRKFKLVYTRQMDLPRRKKDLYHRLIYGRIDLLLVISRRLREKALQNLPIRSNKVKLLYYGVSVAEVAKSPFRTAERDLFKIGMFSRIGWKKGHHTLLHALGILKDKGYQAVTYFYGDVMESNYFQQLKTIIAENDLKHIHFKGFHDNPISIMSYFDVVALPSLNETFGLVAVEAMLMNTVIMAANSGGLPEIIEHNQTGILFEPDNPKSLALHLERLISNPELRTEIAKNGQKSALEHFNEQAHYRQLACLLGQTLRV